MTNSLWKDIQFIPFNDFVVDLPHATTDIQQFTLSVLAYSGMFGNSVFFICSAWFLIDQRETNIKKFVYTYADVWIISMLMLVLTLTFRGSVDIKLLIKAIFPNFFGNNWYATCYLLFLLLYPILNSVIQSMSQTKLLRTSIFLGFVYLFLNFIHPSFFTSKIILWVSIYFVIAYVKLYLPSFCENKKLNLILLAGGVAANVVLITVTNFIGLRVGVLSNRLLYWNSDCSPLLIATAFATFNLFRTIKFQSKFISAISKLTLLIYLFHENLLFRNYYRPYLWKFIYDIFGYKYIIFWLFALSALVFVVSIIISFIYEKTLQRTIKRLCDILYPKVREIYLKIESIFLKVH